MLFLGGYFYLNDKNIRQALLEKIVDTCRVIYKWSTVIVIGLFYCMIDIG